MKVYKFSIIFQLLLMNLVDILIQYVSCERMDSSKTETKVEIEINYLHHDLHDKSIINVKSTSLTYNIPNLPKTTESRSIYRHAGNNNNNLRNGHRSAGNEKTTGSLPMPTYENEVSETGIRSKHNTALLGKLIHVVGVPQQLKYSTGNTSVIPWVHNACHETINSVEGRWIALVQTDGCSTDKKIKQIMKLSKQPLCILIYGSAQVIIRHGSFFSSNQDDAPLVIYLPWNDIQIVVQRCFNNSGHIVLPSDLLKKINRSTIDWPFSSENQCNASIKVYITSDDNFLNRTSVLFVSISFILLMVISLAWLMFYYVQRFRYIHTKEQFSRRLAHMAKKAVAKIPVKTIKQGDKETDAEVDNCAICIECYKPSDTVRILPCMHYFHKGCIDPWLLEQRNCPMCKLNILHAYGFLANERGSVISEDHLSELDSSVEMMQFISGPVNPTAPTTTTTTTTTIAPTHNRPYSLIQSHHPPLHTLDVIAPGSRPQSIAALTPIVNDTISQLPNRWASFRLKSPFNTTLGQDRRSLSLRHLPSNAEERTSFLSRCNKQLSHSATDAGGVEGQMRWQGHGSCGSGEGDDLMATDQGLDHTDHRMDHREETSM